MALSLVAVVAVAGADILSLMDQPLAATVVLVLDGILLLSILKAVQIKTVLMQALH
jgi:hypothetical protein